jgi:signal transduction histidine kinase
MLKNYDNDQIKSLAFTGSLLQGTAHNINTPLSSILGRADILRLRLDRVLASIQDQDVLQELEKSRRDISLIIDNCNRVSGLVKNTVHRCNTSIQNTIKPVNIAGVLREDLEFFLSDMEFKHNIEKIFRIDISMPTIVGAHVHFSNSFTEILDNALAAMRDNETKILTVSAQADGNSIVVSISDNGRGMDEQKRLSTIQTLEHPVQTYDRPLSGLAYVAVLLQPYKPRFQVESSPGNTTLTVVFPVQVHSQT